MFKKSFVLLWIFRFCVEFVSGKTKATSTVIFPLTHKIDWGENNWALRCNFRGNNLTTVASRGERCGEVCWEHDGCTHFVWTNEQNGTCFLKGGNVSRSDAFSYGRDKAVCGIIAEKLNEKATSSSATDNINWDGNDWALLCNFRGNNIKTVASVGEHCGDVCWKHDGCTHFVWTNERNGTCFLKGGNVRKSDAFSYRKDGAVCGIVTDKLDERGEEIIPVSDVGINSDLTCIPSLTKVDYMSPCQKTIIFEDNFDYIDESKWLKVKRFSSEPDHEFVVYIPDNDILHAKNGILCIKPKRLESVYGENAHLESLDLGKGCTSAIIDDCVRLSGATITPPIISAQITTINTFSFLYGRVEIRAKLPSENWIFPQLFLEPKYNFYGKSDLASGQMRIAFTKGRDGKLYGGVLLGSKEPYRSRRMYRNSFIHLSDDFHVFSLEWTQDHIEVAVDDQTYCRIDSQSGFNTEFLGDVMFPQSGAWSKSQSKIAPFDKEFYLTFGVGVGGINDFDDEPFSSSLHKPWKNTEVKAMKHFWKAMKPVQKYPGDRSALEIDYVKVYSL